MTGFNSKIDSQDCYIEINQDDLVINNKSSQISCKAFEIDENIFEYNFEISELGLIFTLNNLILLNLSFLISFIV